MYKLHHCAAHDAHSNNNNSSSNKSLTAFYAAPAARASMLTCWCHPLTCFGKCCRLFVFIFFFSTKVFPIALLLLLGTKCCNNISSLQYLLLCASATVVLINVFFVVVVALLLHHPCWCTFVHFVIIFHFIFCCCVQLLLLPSLPLDEIMTAIQWRFFFLFFTNSCVSFAQVQFLSLFCFWFFNFIFCFVLHKLFSCNTETLDAAFSIFCAVTHSAGEVLNGVSRRLRTATFFFSIS